LFGKDTKIPIYIITVNKYWKVLASFLTFSFDHVITCPKAFRLGADEVVILDFHGYTNGARINAYLQVGFAMPSFKSADLFVGILRL